MDYTESRLRHTINQPEVHMPCSMCGGSCQPLVSVHNPLASEWYCAKCHKSHPMGPMEYEQQMMMRQAAGQVTSSDNHRQRQG